MWCIRLYIKWFHQYVRWFCLYDDEIRSYGFLYENYRILPTPDTSLENVGYVRTAKLFEDKMSSAERRDRLAAALDAIGMRPLIQRFIDEKVDDNTFGSISDEQLSRLGISTIGDRIRLRERMRASDSEAPEGSGYKIHFELILKFLRLFF